MTIQSAFLIISITLLFGSVIYLLVARFSPEGGRSQRTPTNVYAVTGGAMSLLIAFTLSAMFAQYNDASAAIIVIMFFDHPYSDTPGSIKPAAMQTVYQHMINDQIGDVPLPSCPTSSRS